MPPLGRHPKGVPCAGIKGVGQGVGRPKTEAGGGNDFVHFVQNAHGILGVFPIEFFVIFV